MELIRSGSAPPTVEGSGGALHGADVFLDDELRADPAYHSYYYSSVNNNPRLPPPLLSREDWRSAQRLRPGGPGSGLGGIGDGRRPTAGGAGTGRPGDGLIGMPGLEIGTQSSFSGLFQDDSYQHDTNRQGANSNSTDLLGSSRNRYGLHHESGAMQVLAQHVENQDRTVRALRYELYTSRAHLWDALVQLIPLVRSGHLPLDVLYPARTQMPSHVAWPEVGGHTPPRGLLLPPSNGVVPRLCPNGPQGPEFISHFPTPHKELPGYYGCF